MRNHRLITSVAVGAGLFAPAAEVATAQEALPTIDIGAQTQRTEAGAKSYWRQLDEAKQIPEGSYAAPYSSTGTKTDTPIMETPLNVQVVTPQQLKDRQVTTFAEAVQYVSGVNVQRATLFDSYSGAPRIVIRGFEAGTLRNGFRDSVGFLNGAGQGFANVESVEVLKGSSAILYGLVEPGGIVNIVTKKPQEKAAVEVQQQFGSFNFYRTRIGATGPITQDKSVLYRVDISYENAGSFIDNVHTDNFFVAPVLRWDISQSTQATVELEYKKATDAGFVPVSPTFEGHRINIHRSRNYGEYSPWRDNYLLIGANWSHTFNDDWNFRHQIQYKSVDLGSRGIPATAASVGIYDRGVAVSRIGFEIDPFNANQFATQANLSGHFFTGELEHRSLIGADFYRSQRYLPAENTFIDLGSVDVFGLFPVTVPDYSNFFHVGKAVAVGYHYGLYVQDQIKLPFNLQLLGGVRYQNFSQLAKTADPDSGAFTTTPSLRVQRVTPRVALLWRPQEWISAYANYAEGFGANEGMMASNKPLPPSDARQWEIGGKTEFFDGRLRATLAYFDITKTNVPTGDLLNPGYSIVTGEVNAKGAELDIQGEILPGWNVTVAYSNTEARITKSNNLNVAGGSEVGERFFGVPRNAASFFSTYEFKQGDWKGFKFGGGVNYSDSTPMLNFTTISHPFPSTSAYATVDLMAAYEFRISNTKWTAQLNISNLLDQTYYTFGYKLSQPGSGWSNDYVGFGKPRSVMGSISASF